MLDVHFFATDRPPAETRRLAALLDDGERAHAARFRSRRDRDRFTVRRAQRRLILAAATGSDPAVLGFDHNAYGKPRLRGGGTTFSTSHAAGIGLCVVAQGREVGCDVAFADPALADPAVARRLFAPGEWRDLAALPAAAWVTGFYDVWTRKEAFVKALGGGLSMSLDAFRVSVDPAAPASLIGGGGGWTLAAVVAPGGYRAAVVVEDGAGA